MLNIKKIRERQNITQDEMVAQTGIPKRSYVDYENEKSDIQLSKLRKIATILKVTVSELIGETNSEEKVIKQIDNINDNFFDNKPKVKNKLSNDFHLDIFSEPNSEYANVLRKIKFSKDISITDQGAPFYPMPISAGTVAELLKEPEKPNGFISIPGVSCKAYFPVIGCSFEPYIKAGGIIGVDFIDRWEILDPDCIYFIITHDQRMLKRLQRDSENDGKLLCISPNYKSFTIDINDIKAIHKVVFYGSFV